MVAIPAWVWRFGLIVRALIGGFSLGVFLAILAWVGSGLAVSALAAVVLVTLLYAPLAARRMSRYWPGARDLSGPDRVAVVRAARSGRGVDDPRLASGVIEYSRALHSAAERSRWFWWLMALLGVVALGAAIVDTILGPVREMVVSWLYFAFFPFEAWWWPRRQARLLANAQRAEGSAAELLVRHDGT